VLLLLLLLHVHLVLVLVLVLLLLLLLLVVVHHAHGQQVHGRRGEVRQVRCLLLLLLLLLMLLLLLRDGGVVEVHLRQRLLRLGHRQRLQRIERLGPLSSRSV
jgi:hypothetical protein